MVKLSTLKKSKECGKYAMESYFGSPSPASAFVSNPAQRNGTVRPNEAWIYTQLDTLKLQDTKELKAPR